MSKKRIMKTIIITSLLLALIIILQACTSESKSGKSIGPARIKNENHVSDAKLHSYVYQELDTCIELKEVFPKYNKEIENTTPEIVANAISSPIATDYDLISKIDELEDNLIEMQKYNFADCSQTESKIIVLTQDFFYIVEKIDANDSVCISMFSKLDSFAELLEPSLIEAEESCPDLYNEYMEIIDNYNDLYADKIGLIFSINK